MRVGVWGVDITLWVTCERWSHIGAASTYMHKVLQVIIELKGCVRTCPASKLFPWAESACTQCVTCHNSKASQFTTKLRGAMRGWGRGLLAWAANGTAFEAPPLLPLCCRLSSRELLNERCLYSASQAAPNCKDTNRKPQIPTL